MNPSTRYALTIHLRQQVLRRRLLSYKGFMGLPIHQLQEAYNGCGPDSFPDSLRWLLTAVFQRLEPAFFEHDAAYAYCKNRSYGSFTKANWRLLINCLILIRHYYPCCPPTLTLFFRGALVSMLLAFFCQLGGWRGWKAQTGVTKGQRILGGRFAQYPSNRALPRKKKRRK